MEKRLREALRATTSRHLDFSIDFIYLKCIDNLIEMYIFVLFMMTVFQFNDIIIINEICAIHFV